MLPYVTGLSTHLRFGYQPSSPEHADRDRCHLVESDVTVTGVGPARRLVVVRRLERTNHLVGASRDSHRLVFEGEASDCGRGRYGHDNGSGPRVHDMDELFACVAETVAVNEDSSCVGRDNASLRDVLSGEVRVRDDGLRSVVERSQGLSGESVVGSSVAGEV